MELRRSAAWLAPARSLPLHATGNAFWREFTPAA